MQPEPVRLPAYYKVLYIDQASRSNTYSYSYFLLYTRHMKRMLYALAVILILGTGFARIASAAPPEFSIANTVQIADTEAIDGDVMSLDKDANLTRSTKVSDDKMYGVLVEKPQIVYRTNSAIPVVRNGTAYVNVTTAGGPIVIGDYITTSSLAGKAMKAPDSSGYMLGAALAPFDGKEGGTPVTVDGKPYMQGRLLVAIGIGPSSPILFKAGGGIMGTVKQIANAVMYNIGTSKQFERLTRILLAALIALLVIYISFRTFGKNITKGIEAIGRNPLAKNSIQAMIIMNVILILVVSIGGIILALVIVSL